MTGTDISGKTYALVVDDHPLVARGMAMYLTTHCGFPVVHTAADSAGCEACVREHGPPSLAVLDFWLSDGTALALVAELARQCPGARLLTVSGDDDPALQIKAREAGAHGFLPKHEAPEAFAHAVAVLCAGGQWFTHTEGSMLLPALRQRGLPLRPGDLGLTERQGEVLGKVLRGLPNKRIAQELGLAESTVKEHITGILERLGVTNRVEAINLLRGRCIKT